MRIVHFSDWHGTPHECPEADVYVSTGDHCPNFPVRRGGGKAERLRRFGDDDWRIDPAHEESTQREWARSCGFVDSLPSKDAPIVCVRGNHDFIDAKELFPGRTVHEIVASDDRVEALGLSFGGMRGINYIAGWWSDELREHDADDRARRISRDVDVLVTHAPPLGILDRLEWSGALGIRALGAYVQRRIGWGGEEEPDKKLLAHCFGHIHEHGGKVVVEDGTTFSNAACSVNVLDLP